MTKLQATQDIMRNTLTSEVKFIISLLAFAMGVVVPFFQQKEDLALMRASISNINSNHEVHMQDFTQGLNDTNKRVETQQTQLNILQTQQAVILERLK